MQKTNGIAQFPRGTRDSGLLWEKARLQYSLANDSVSIRAPWWGYARITLVAVMALLCSHKFFRPYATIDMLGPVVACIGGYPMFRVALANLMRRRLTAELSLTVAVPIALLIDELSTALVIILLALLTRAVEQKAIARSRRELHRLLQAQSSSVVTAIEQAFQFPGSVERTAEWLLSFLICLSLGAGVFTFFTIHDVRSALSATIVGGVCVLASSTLLGILGAFACAAGHGVVIKSKASLEELANVDLMVLDEAGIPPHSTLPAAEPLLENGFCSNARLAVAALKKMKIETVLFSSSLEPIVRPIGEKLGVEQVEAELFPEDKCCKLAALQRRAKKVALLSNDVKAGSALFHADVAVVVGAPACVEESVGDAFFISKNLNDFAMCSALPGARNE